MTARRPDTEVRRVADMRSLIAIIPVATCLSAMKLNPAKI